MLVGLTSLGRFGTTGTTRSLEASHRYPRVSKFHFEGPADTERVGWKRARSWGNVDSFLDKETMLRRGPFIAFGSASIHQDEHGPV